jgi:hypothetical protein
MFAYCKERRIKELECDHNELSFKLEMEHLDEERYIWVFHKKCEECGKIIKDYGFNHVLWKKDHAEYLRGKAEKITESYNEKEKV